MIQSQRGAEGPRDLDHGTVPPDGRPLAEQPKWRRDFPIDWAQDEYVSRRELVKFIVLTSAALAVGQFWIVLKSLFGRRRGTAAGRADRRRGRAVRSAEPRRSPTPKEARPGCSCGRARPRSSRTTSSARTSCVPSCPPSTQGRLHCPCHNGWFDLETGRPLAGPPRGALPRVLLEVRDGAVYATGVEEAAT